MIVLNWTDFPTNCADRNEITAYFVNQCNKRDILSRWSIMGPMSNEEDSTVSWYCYCEEKDYSFLFSMPVLDYLSNREKTFAKMEELAGEIHGSECQWTMLSAMDMTREQWLEKIENADKVVRLDGEGSTQMHRVQRYLDDMHEEEKEAEKTTIILPD